MNLGIFGGTFNPIHYGHLRAAEEVREKLGLDKIIFVPSGTPPLKDKELADARDRYKMTRLAIFKNRSFELSDIEYKSKNKSYSVDTIRKFQRLYPRSRLYFILGIDAFADIPNWRQPEKLISLTDFVIITRPGFSFESLSASPYIGADRRVLKKIDAGETRLYRTRLESGKTAIMLSVTPVGISATGIRTLIRQGKSIKYLLPEEVESFIISNKLYDAPYKKRRRKNL